MCMYLYIYLQICGFPYVCVQKIEEECGIDEDKREYMGNRIDRKENVQRRRRHNRRKLPNNVEWKRNLPESRNFRNYADPSEPRNGRKAIEKGSSKAVENEKKIGEVYVVRLYPFLRSTGLPFSERSAFRKLLDFETCTQRTLSGEQQTLTKFPITSSDQLWNGATQFCWLLESQSENAIRWISTHSKFIYA